MSEMLKVSVPFPKSSASAQHHTVLPQVLWIPAPPAPQPPRHTVDRSSTFRHSYIFPDQKKKKNIFMVLGDLEP